MAAWGRGWVGRGRVQAREARAKGRAKGETVAACKDESRVGQQSPRDGTKEGFVRSCSVRVRVGQIRVQGWGKQCQGCKGESRVAQG